MGSGATQVNRAPFTGRETRSCCFGAVFENSGVGIAGSGGRFSVKTWDFGRASKDRPVNEGALPLVVSEDGWSIVVAPLWKR